MKKTLMPVIGLVVGVAAALWLPQETSGQMGPAAAASEAVLRQEIADQQQAILAKQGEIDAMSARIAETLRQARIFTGRGG
jgi:hypothetical protein